MLFCGEAVDEDKYRYRALLGDACENIPDIDYSELEEKLITSFNLPSRMSVLIVANISEENDRYIEPIKSFTQNSEWQRAVN